MLEESYSTLVIQRLEELERLDVVMQSGNLELLLNVGRQFRLERVNVGALVDARVLEQVADRPSLYAFVHSVAAAHAFDLAFVHLEFKVFDVLRVEKA